MKSEPKQRPNGNTCSGGHRPGSRSRTTGGAKGKSEPPEGEVVFRVHYGGQQLYECSRLRKSTFKDFDDLCRTGDVRLKERLKDFRLYIFRTVALDQQLLTSQVW